ncbi:MAG: DUF4384 domain-containing protein [Sulfobacillus sp.]
MRYSMEAQWGGGEEDSPDKIIHLATSKALETALRCSGQQNIIQSFYDSRYQKGKKGGQTIEEDLYVTMSALSDYSVINEGCPSRPEGGFVCRVVVNGKLRVQHPDPGFEVVTNGIGLRESSSLMEGENVQVSFHLTMDANVYLFDVDEEGNAYLLFPGPENTGLTNPIQAGQPVTYPPTDSGIALTAYLPSGRETALEHIYIFAVRGGFHLITRSGTKKKTVRAGELLEAGNFRKQILRKLLQVPRNLWTMKVLPFEIRKLEQ